MESSSANICANCGKGEEESDNLKKCSACLSIKYCSRECQAAHRPQHKKECKKRAAEIYDEKLFAEPPPREECPICMLPLPIESSKTAFNSCCGKLICIGCLNGMVEGKVGGKVVPICAFCRTPLPTSDEEQNKRVKKLTDRNHPYSFNFLAGAYDQGLRGLSQDRQKANKLYLKAGEFGCAEGYYNLGIAHDRGRAWK